MSHRLIALTLLLLVTLALVACGLGRLAAPSAPPATITITLTIVDGSTQQPLLGTVFVDNQPIAHTISAGKVAVPADMQRHSLRVEASGCQPWRIDVRSPAPHDITMQGPARLQCGDSAGHIEEHHQ